MNRESIALVFSLWRLRQRLNRYNGFWVATYGLLLPGVLSLWAQSHASDRDFSKRVIVGTFVLGLFSLAAKRVAQTTTRERNYGVWDLLKTTRITRNHYLIAHVLDLLAQLAVPMAGLAIAALLYPDLTPRSVKWVLPAVLSALTFGALALLIAGVVPHRLCGMIVNAMLVLSLAFCPMLYPSERVPRGLWPVVRVLPPTLATEAMLPAWNGAAVPAHDVAGLLIWACVAAILVLRFFPWTTERS
jgi:ABC-type polysaccharide/polyol phosphate export permease